VLTIRFFKQEIKIDVSAKLRAGFSLVELVVVLFIIFILSVISFETFKRQIIRKKVETTAEDIKIALIKAQSYAFKKGKTEVLFETHGLKILDSDKKELYKVEFPEWIFVKSSLKKVYFYRSKLPSANLSIEVRANNYHCNIVLSFVSGKISLECG